MEYAHENKAYIAAAINKDGDVVKLNTGKEYTLNQIEGVVKHMNEHYTAERQALGFTKFVAYNKTAEDMLPPYYLYDDH